MNAARLHQPEDGDPARPDQSWRRLYRAGGIAALVYVGLVLVPVVLVLVAPVPPTDGRALLEYIAEHKVLYLAELVCFVGLAVPALVVFIFGQRTLREGLTAGSHR